MDSLIKKIIKIEARAQEIVQIANDEKKEIENDMQSQIASLEEEINLMVEGKKNELIQKAHDDAEERIKKLDKKTKQELTDMHDNANENMTMWEDNIVSSIIERK